MGARRVGGMLPRGIAKSKHCEEQKTPQLDDLGGGPVIMGVVQL